MIEYALQNTSGALYYLNGELIDNITRGSMTFQKETFTIDNKIKEKSAGAGSVALGESRLKARTLALQYERINVLDQDFMQAENELISACINARYIVDITNDRRCKVRVSKSALSYDKGSHKLSGSGTISIEMLTPFWEDNTPQEVTGSISGGAQDSISFQVGGYYDIQPRITLVASEVCDTLEIFLNAADPSDRVGLNIDDPLFGSAGYETLALDCEEGTVTIADLDRSQFVEEGTGYFALPAGDHELVFNPAGDIDVTIAYRRRYFI